MVSDWVEGKRVFVGFSKDTQTQKNPTHLQTNDHDGDSKVLGEGSLREGLHRQELRGLRRSRCWSVLLASSRLLVL